MTDFNDLSINREFGGIQVTTLIVAATIKPSSVLVILSGTGTIINIIPPVDGYHELNFIIGNDFVLFDIGGNIILPSAGPFSTVTNSIVKLYFNPLNKRYYSQNILYP